jgi:hypothetical protein
MMPPIARVGGAAAAVDTRLIPRQLLAALWRRLDRLVPPPRRDALDAELPPEFFKYPPV